MIPQGATVIKNTNCSQVYLHENWIYKRSVPFAENEYRWLKALEDSEYVPKAQWLGDSTFRTEYLGDHQESWASVTGMDEFMSHEEPLLRALQEAGVRHGDLTRLAIIVRDNKPMLIDFAQSRALDSSQPDKRPEGDSYWLRRTMQEILEMSGKR